MHDQHLENLLLKSAALHDHLCPRQVLGVRMGMLAGELLNLNLPQCDKRLLTLVETDGCFCDGVAVATGCWMGRRTLRLVDHGKIAATFVDTATGRAVRIHPSEASRRLAPLHAPNAVDRWHAYLEGYQLIPADELFAVRWVELTCGVEELVSLPDRRAICGACGEEISNEREVIVDGSVRCRACAGQPYLKPATEVVEGRRGA